VAAAGYEMKAKTLMALIFPYATALFVVATVCAVGIPILQPKRIDVGPSASARKRIAMIKSLSAQADGAIKSRNYQLAQKLFDEMLAVGVSRAAIGLDRSGVYEKQGEPKLAYLALKDSIGEANRSMTSESWLLAKLGEWAWQYGTQQEALDDDHRVIVEYNLKLDAKRKPIDEARLSPNDTRATALSLDAL
jgi:hypothetical protein